MGQNEELDEQTKKNAEEQPAQEEPAKEELNASFKRKIFPWEIRGANLDTMYKFNKMSSYLLAPGRMLDREEEVLDVGTVYRELIEKHDNEGVTDEFLTKLKEHPDDYAGLVLIGEKQNSYKFTMTDEVESGFSEFADFSERTTLQKEYDEKVGGIVKDFAGTYRDKYAERTDKDGKRYDRAAKQMADWYEGLAHIYNPREGNILEASYHAPYLTHINALSADAPRFDTLGFEECVDILNQKGVQDGKPILDDLMTMLNAGAEETKIQYERQQAEREGWDADKEKRYLSDLNKAHKKVTEAYDRLWDIDDNGQYDSALNNKLDSMIGKKSGNNRDCNADVGYMKGELRAIEMGYDSRHLYILGQVGLQEQMLKKLTANNEDDLQGLENSTDPEAARRVTDRRDALKRYREDFNALKEKVWSTEVSSAEDMKKVGQEVETFFAEHKKEYGQLQSRFGNIENSLAYFKELENEPVLRHNGHDHVALAEIPNTIAMLYGDIAPLTEYAKITGCFEELDPSVRDASSALYTRDAEERTRKLARDYSQNLDRHIKDAEDYIQEHPETARGKKFEIALLNINKQMSDDFAEGMPFSVNRKPNPYVDSVHRTVASLAIQINPDCFKPEMLESTGKAVEELGLDVFAEKSLELQRRTKDLALNRDKMEDSEHRDALAELNARRIEMRKMAKDLQEKMKNPSPEVLELFTKESQLKDFMGSRGLQRIINACDVGAQPWEIEGKNLSICGQLTKMVYNNSDLVKSSGRKKELDEIAGLSAEIVEENDEITLNGEEDGPTASSEFIAECKRKNYAGIKISGEKFVVDIGRGDHTFATFADPGQEKRLQDAYTKAADIVKASADAYRRQYSDRTDARGMRYNEKANDLADWMEENTAAYDPKSVNVMKVMYSAPYLNSLISNASAIPKYEKLGFEECVDGLGPVYDDFMELMHSPFREILIQSERQKSEAEGWNAEKEGKFLDDLKASHLKTIGAFERLLKVDDQGQYDKYLNNNFDHVLGKNAGDTRDANDSIGYMKGEVRGIDLGYDSKHLYIMGQIGLQEQCLKKARSDNDQQLADTKDPKLTMELLDKRKKIKEYETDFNAFKEKLWNTHVRSKEDMWQAGKEVEQFFEDHRKKYGELQNSHDAYLSSYTYSSNEAERSELISAPTPLLDYDSARMLQQISAVMAYSYGDESYMVNNQDLVNKYYEALADNSDDVPAIDAEIKDLANNVSKALEQKIDLIPDDPVANKFRKAVLNASKVFADNTARGIGMKAESPYKDSSFEQVFGFYAWFREDTFSPENIHAAGEVIQKLGLMEFANAAAELQEKTQEFELNKDLLSQADREAALADLNGKREAMLGLTEDLYHKLDDPSVDLSVLFSDGKRAREDLQSGRGLDKINREYMAQLKKTDFPEAKGLDEALEKFNTRRAWIFSSESTEHKELREATERVREHMNVLSTGKKDLGDGNTVQLTDDELLEELTAAEKAAKEMEKKADDYAKLRGNPSTEAGRNRLEGAKGIIKYADSLRTKLSDRREVLEDLKKRTAEHAKERELEEELKKAAEKEREEEDIVPSLEEEELAEQTKKQAEEAAKAEEAPKPEEAPKVEEAPKAQEAPKAGEPEAAKADPLTAVRNRIEGWNRRINSDTFPADGFEAIQSSMADLNAYADKELQVLANGKIDAIKLVELHEHECNVIKGLEDYLRDKVENPQNRNNEAEQKRMDAAIDLLSDIKMDAAHITGAVVDNMQTKARTQLSEYLEEEERKREEAVNRVAQTGMGEKDYGMSVDRTMTAISNLNGKNWVPREKETLSAYVDRIDGYKPDKMRARTEKDIAVDKSAVHDGFKDAVESFKAYKKDVKTPGIRKDLLESSKKSIPTTTEQIKEKYMDFHKFRYHEGYQEKAPKYDLDGQMKKINDDRRRLKEALLNGPKKENQKENKKEGQKEIRKENNGPSK